MKKLLAVLALAVFLGGLSAPVIAASNNSHEISVNTDDPKDKKTEKTENAEKAEKKSEAKSDKSCDTAKKGDCSKKCGDK